MRRRPSRYLLPLCCACLLAVVASAVPAAAAETLVLGDPVTDNYKASYNEDPSQTELRTWLSLRSLEAAGTTWTPTPPGSIQVVLASGVQLVAADGRRGALDVQVRSGPADGLFVRIDPLTVESGGRWGPLLAITSVEALRAEPVVLVLTLSVDGAALAFGAVSYQHDPALAAAPPGTLEDNGPSGRWIVGTTATRLNWDAAPPAPQQLVAGDPADPASGAAPVARPRITQLLLPVRTTRRLVQLGVRGRAGGLARITSVRVRVGTRAWSSWTPVRPTYSVVLPRGRALHAVQVQVRDAASRTSPVVTRRVRCLC